jgi:hypothetical protein
MTIGTLAEDSTSSSVSLAANLQGPTGASPADSNEFYNTQTKALVSAVQRVLASGSLPSAWELATLDGLDAYLAARANGDRERQSRPPIPHDPSAGILVAPLASELTSIPSLQTGDLEPLPSDVFAVGALFCLIGDQLLLNGRFVVTVAFQQLNGLVGIALACALTPSAGYFFFFDRFNVEIPIKMLNACFGGAPATHWVFAAGLTNFGVEISIFDLATGIRRSYLNPTGRIFESIIDQQTPFPCP